MCRAHALGRAARVEFAVRGEQLLSLSTFNAALPDIVQLGGIYTPPALRGRGYVKHAIAAQLREARERGASRAVLFTKNPNAVRAYEALGFSRIGDFFARPLALTRLSARSGSAMLHAWYFAFRRRNKPSFSLQP
ncbi:MAG: GNAT family N-acetyltransferase [Deltaproteobacteria bacterium]